MPTLRASQAAGQLLSLKRKSATRSRRVVRTVAQAGQSHEQVVAQVIRSALAGDISPDQAAKTISAYASGMKHVADFAVLDNNRAEDRTGFPEVVWGPGKSPQQIVDVMNEMVQHQRIAMATRVEAPVYAAAKELNPELEYNSHARIMTLRSPNWSSLPKTEKLPGSVAVVSAGTSDVGVAEEARLTAELMGCYVFKITDVGVAGLHRIVKNLPALRAADVVIVVSGMDGALPSVIAGVVETPVISVPSSVGYGAALAGFTPLLASLNAAPGVSVVNIDNGFGAAMMAARILRTSSRLFIKRTASMNASTNAAQTTQPQPSTATQAGHNDQRGVMQATRVQLQATHSSGYVYS